MNYQIYIPLFIAFYIPLATWAFILGSNIMDKHYTGNESTPFGAVIGALCLGYLGLTLISIPVTFLLYVFRIFDEYIDRRDRVTLVVLGIKSKYGQRMGTVNNNPALCITKKTEQIHTLIWDMDSEIDNYLAGVK